MPRPLWFEIHVRPMFREVDRVHMKALFDIDLWDYASVTANLDLIDGALNAAPSATDANAVMPPSNCGGPWPEEWLALWAEWKKDPKSMPLGTATEATLARIDAGMLELTVRGVPSQKNAAVWMEALPQREIPPRFVLYEEPPRDKIKGNGLSFEVVEQFPAGSATSVQFTDSKGTRTIALT